MHYVKQFEINGVATKQVACIELHGKPNAATEGYVGVLGIDVDSPLHDVYKCVAVNGSIYTWDLLSSGLSIMSASISGGGATSAQFPYDNLRTPISYVVKIGDLVLDKDGYLYQIDALNTTYCSASYCKTRIVAYGMSAYDLAVEQGYEGSLEQWLADQKGDKGDKGDQGSPGLTPYIGNNGNWWIGGTDTGSPVLRTVTGSYTGDSTSGTTVSKKLTFDFKPTLVIVKQDALNQYNQNNSGTQMSPLILIRPSTKANVGNTSVTWGDNYVSWSGYSANSQYNYSGCSYTYVAFGEDKGDAADVDVLNSWEKVQKAVRAGNAPALYPVGTQFLVNHKVYKLLVFTVVAHNHFKSASDASAPTMTLLCQSQFLSMSFAHQEAMYYADTALSAGTYNFKLSSKLGSWAAGNYYFTLTQALPKGGQLVIDGGSSTALTGLTISSYSSNTSTEAMETVAIKSGTSGTNLGTLGSTSTLNHPRRITQGSNNYKESDIRIFLNSTAPSNIWTPQTKFDRPPTWANSLTGFAAGFEDDFLSCVGEVIVPCTANDTYESPDSTTTKGSDYTVNDKFYLLSEKEIFGTPVTGANDQSTLLEYYVGASNVDRIEYWEMQASYWWTRTPLAGYPGSAVMVQPDGSSVSSSAMNPRMCIPAFTIV